MNILVTGAAGFIGSNLVKRLKKDGHKVVGWDITTGQDVCTINCSPKMDAIFHLACPVNPADYQAVTLETIFASTLGTWNMLELARRNNAKFLYVSSSEVYGELWGNWSFKEDAMLQFDSESERTFYGASKLMGEVLTMFYHRNYGVNVRIIRPFNIYGPGMRKDDTRVVPSFIRKIKNNRSVQITGHKKTIRTFLYIDDFIEGLCRSMFYPKTNGEIFNLGSTKTISIQQLANLMNARIEFIPARAGEQQNRRPNINKAKKILKWQPVTSLKKGLELMWQSYP